MSGGPDLSDPLSRFRLRDSDHTDLFGIFMAVHALPGAVMLLHTTVGCKFKTQLHLVHHDWMRESHNQRLWTGVDDVRLIKGSGERLIEFATTWYERRRPQLFVVTTNTAVELSAFDVEAAVQVLRERLPCPVLLLKAPGYEGSMWRGYQRMVRAVLELCDFSEGQGQDEVAVIGYFMDRYEMDHAANLVELRRILSLIGLKVRAVLFGGDDVDTVLRAGRASGFVVLPYASDLCSYLHSKTNRPVIETGLPIGIEGTNSFLREVAKAMGVHRKLVEEAVERERGRAEARVRMAAKNLNQTTAALFLDTPMATAIYKYLSDLGVRVALVCLTDGQDASGFTKASRVEGNTEVISGASRDEAIRALYRLRDREKVQLVVGSAVQQAALEREHLPIVELGYPSSTKHWLYPMPYIGYNGALALAQRFLDCASEALAF